jgi:hypothetical protein
MAVVQTSTAGRFAPRIGTRLAFATSDRNGGTWAPPLRSGRREKRLADLEARRNGARRGGRWKRYGAVVHFDIVDFHVILRRLSNREPIRPAVPPGSEAKMLLKSFVSVVRRCRKELVVAPRRLKHGLSSGRTGRIGGRQRRSTVGPGFGARDHAWLM